MKLILLAFAALLSCTVLGSALAQEDRLAERLLRAAQGLQMPSSEADSSWSFFSYAGVTEPPEAEPFGTMVGCPQGGAARLDFEETMERLGTVEPWMDEGQARSARGFRKLVGMFGREFGGKLAAYRCNDGGPEVGVYFLGADEDGLRGLATINIET